MLRFMIYSLRLWLIIPVDFVRTWLSTFLPESSEDAPVWLLTAYIVNYKDPWQHPVKPGRAMGL